MFSDRHYPPSFLAGNRSLRDMIKDPEEYDRRLESFNKRREDESKAKEVREENIKRVIEEKNRYACPPRFYNNDSSRSSNKESSQPPTAAPREVSNTPKSYQDVYVRNRVSRYTPEPERSFTMFVHGAADVKRERPERPSARLSSNLMTTNADSPFQRRNRGAPTSTSYVSSFFSSEPKNSNSSWYLVRRTASAGEVAPEIVPISNTYRPYTSSNSTLTSRAAKKIEEPQFYTDKHFSSKFLSDSVPLSQMIRYKK